MSLPFLAAKLPLGSSIAVNYSEQSKIRQVTISKSSQCYVRMDTDKHLNLGPGRETQIPTQNDRVTPKYVI